MSEIPDDLMEELTQAMAAGDKIGAIKRYKEWAGVSLLDAKTFIDDLEQQHRGEQPAFGQQPRMPRAMPDMPEDQAQAMTEAIFAGRKIEAIKLHNAATRVGLNNSKDFVEELQRQLREECPERFTASTRTGCGAVALLGGLLGLGVLIA